MKKIRVLIADDHPVVREGLAGMLAGQPDFEVVGMAANGEMALVSKRCQ
jgi:DNA-binding NarL/FixJ family response regulator